MGGAALGKVLDMLSFSLSLDLQCSWCVGKKDKLAMVIDQVARVVFDLKIV